MTDDIVCIRRCIVVVGMLAELKGNRGGRVLQDEICRTGGAIQGLGGGLECIQYQGMEWQGILLRPRRGMQRGVQRGLALWGQWHGTPHPRVTAAMLNGRGGNVQPATCNHSCLNPGTCRSTGIEGGIVDWRDKSWGTGFSLPLGNQICSLGCHDDGIHRFHARWYCFQWRVHPQRCLFQSRSLDNVLALLL